MHHLMENLELVISWNKNGSFLQIEAESITLISSQKKVGVGKDRIQVVKGWLTPRNVSEIIKFVRPLQFFPSRILNTSGPIQKVDNKNMGTGLPASHCGRNGAWQDKVARTFSNLIESNEPLSGVSASARFSKWWQISNSNISCILVGPAPVR